MQSSPKSIAAEISVVAPIYKGERYVDELIDRLTTSLATLTTNFEIVLVDDGSPDDGWEKICAAAAREPRVKGLRLSRNFGQHPAITAGLDHARGRWVVVMDSDLQDRPEDIPGLYRTALDQKLDVVIARRALQQISYRKRIPSTVFNWLLSWLGGIETHQQIGNFRIFSRNVRDAFLEHREQFRFFPALMARVGFSKGFYDVERNARAQGGSTYTFAKLVSLATDAVVANSEKPLWFGIYSGGVIALVALFMAIWATLRKVVFDVGLSGWSSLFVAVVFFSGVQLMFSGLIGIYVGRIFHETKQRPIYILAERLNLAEATGKFLAADHLTRT
jgi:polyisoprenyl-phosphate glycosyltransferase